MQNTQRFTVSNFFIATCALLGLAQSVQAETVVVLNSGDATVALIDKATYKVVDTFPVGKEPHHLINTPDEKFLLVANAVGNDLTVLDATTGKILRKIPHVDDPYQLAFSPDQKWFATAGNRLDRTDLYHWNGKDVTLAKKIPMAKTPSHIAFTNDSSLMFVTLQDSNEIALVDVATQTMMGKIKTGPAPAGIMLTPDEKYILVGITGADYIEVFDRVTLKSVKKITTGKGAHNFRPVGDKRFTLLSNRISSSISIIDMQKLEKVGDITGLPFGPDDMELSKDGKELWATCRWSKKVAVIDFPNRKLMRTINVGRSPHGLYFPSHAGWK